MGLTLWELDVERPLRVLCRAARLGGGDVWRGLGIIAGSGDGWAPRLAAYLMHRRVLVEWLLGLGGGECEGGQARP